MMSSVNYKSGNPLPKLDFVNMPILFLRLLKLITLHETRKELVNFITKVEINQILNFTPSTHQLFIFRILQT